MYFRKKSTVVILIISLFVFQNLYSQNEKKDSIIQLQKELRSSLLLGLNYIKNNQTQNTDIGNRYRGEWPTTMQMSRSFIYLTKKTKVYDSNCFSVAATHNSLAQIYLMYPEYDNIPGMLNLAFEKILTYKNNQYFNFWNLLPPNMKLKKDDTIGKQELVRRPTNYPLKIKYMNNAANIANDADDTSFGYLAIGLHKLLFGDSSDTTKYLVEPIFSAYRDLNRNNRHWYNHLRGNDHETGAYLTWLSDEYQFKNWNILKTTYHNGIWFHKSSECFPHPYTPYIPYGSNDLDAVVNADILSVLGFNNEKKSPAITAAINYIEYKTKQNQNKIGIYYPNRYHFSFAVSEAYVNGVDALNTSMINLVEFIKKTQNKDGSFSSRRRLNKKDIIQSTAYALNALVNYGSFEKNKTKLVIEKAIHFLIQQSIKDKNGIHWTGGVFFSGGTLIRNMLLWKSDAYTTSIILKAFAKYNKHLEL